MKTILLILIGGFFLTGNSGPLKKQNKLVRGKEINTNIDTLSFTKQIQPIFIKNCSPCHFPGGKLYTKLPFDDPHTILSHESGIMKRIKNPEEISTIKEFIRQNASN
jgi:hypothetical protein